MGFRGSLESKYGMILKMISAFLLAVCIVELFPNHLLSGNWKKKKSFLEIWYDPVGW